VTDGKADHAEALDDTPTDKMCATAGCHESETEKTKAGSHKDAPCETCHGEVHGDFKLFSKTTRRASSATKSEVGALGGQRARHQPEEGHLRRTATATCTTSRLHGHPLSPMSKVLQVSTCSECHDDSARSKAFRDSVHGHGAAASSGLSVAPTCSSCHGSHEIAGGEAPDVGQGVTQSTSPRPVRHVPHLHRQPVEVAASTVSCGSNGTAEEKKKAPLCNDLPFRATRRVDPQVNGNHLAMVKNCAKCHESQSQRATGDSFHGKATNAWACGLAADLR
jgi:hypothetical protein